MVLPLEPVTALGDLASVHRDLCPATVIGVTGSNGKTTVKRMIHHILSRRLTGTCGPKSFNNAIGVPLTLLGTSGGDDYVVCEIGTSAPGEIAALSAIVRPDVAVITSVGETHLEKLGSLERVTAEKAAIVGEMAKDGLAVVRTDSDLLARAVRSYDRRVVWFGESDTAEFRLTGYRPGNRCQCFQLNGRFWIDLPLTGRHNALNALAAIAVAQRLGFSQADAASALADFKGVEMRLQWIDLGNVTILNDAYNANPTSMVAAAAALGEQPAGRRVMIAGDMLELGAAAEDLHVRTGRQIAACGLDLLIGVGRLGRYIAKGAAEAGVPVRKFATVETASRSIRRLLKPGDLVLVKGSRAMRMERLVDLVGKSPVKSAGRKQR